MILLVCISVSMLRVNVINKVAMLKCYVAPKTSVPEATRTCGRNAFASFHGATNLYVNAANQSYHAMSLPLILAVATINRKLIS
jgi:hypothetical protein